MQALFLEVIKPINVVSRVIARFWISGRLDKNVRRGLLDQTRGSCSPSSHIMHFQPDASRKPHKEYMTTVTLSYYYPLIAAGIQTFCF